MSSSVLGLLFESENLKSLTLQAMLHLDLGVREMSTHLEGKMPQNSQNQGTLREIHFQPI